MRRLLPLIAVSLVCAGTPDHNNLPAAAAIVADGPTRPVNENMATLDKLGCILDWNGKKDGPNDRNHT